MRSRLLAAVVLCGTAILVALLSTNGLATAGARNSARLDRAQRAAVRTARRQPAQTHSSAPGIISRNTTATVTPPPPPSVKDPWLAYATAVNPGNQIQFVTPSIGFRVNALDMAPYLDSHLAAGPDGTTVAWPGPSVSESTNGGQTWTNTYSDPDGIWGLDFVSSSTGWIVGVTSIKGTTDGGTSWSQLAEPTAGPLVAVSFASDDVGYGLTVGGTLVVTSDGGASWHSTTLQTPGTALCFSSALNGYVSDATGDVYETNDGGATWRETYQGSVPAGYGPVWSELACTPKAAFDSMRLLSEQASQPPYEVIEEPTGSSTWTTQIVSSTNESLASVSSIAASDTTALVAGLPSVGLSVATSSLSAPSSPLLAPSTQTTPTSGQASNPGISYFSALPVSSAVNGITASAASFFQISGASMAGNDAWIYLTDSAITPLESSGTPLFQTVVLHSSDGGSSWSVVSEAAPTPQPAYTP